MEKTEEDKKGLSPYFVVEFINRGRKPAIKKIDAVFGSWLFVNVKTKNALSKFPEEPYKLQLYLENQLPAPSSWPLYTVRIRGRVCIWNASGWKTPNGKKPLKGLKHSKSKTTKTVETATTLDSHTLNLTSEELVGFYQVLPIVSDDDDVEFDAEKLLNE